MNNKGRVSPQYLLSQAESARRGQSRYLISLLSLLANRIPYVDDEEIQKNLKELADDAIDQFLDVRRQFEVIMRQLHEQIQQGDLEGLSPRVRKTQIAIRGKIEALQREADDSLLSVFNRTLKLHFPQKLSDSDHLRDEPQSPTVIMQRIRDAFSSPATRLGPLEDQHPASANKEPEFLDPPTNILLFPGTRDAEPPKE